MRCSKKTYTLYKCFFYTAGIIAIKIITIIKSGYESIGVQKFTFSWKWQERLQWVPVALFKRHFLSFPKITFALCLYSFSCSVFGPACDTFHQRRSIDIWNFVLSHSKKSIQVSGDSPVCPLVTAGPQSGWVDLHLCPLLQDFLYPPEHTQSPAHFNCKIHTAQLSG